jgi:hypothetical protein
MHLKIFDPVKRVIEAATFCCVVAVVSSRLRRSTSA